MPKIIKPGDEAKVQISISLPEALVAKVDELAERENRNRSNYIATQLQALVDGE